MDLMNPNLRDIAMGTVAPTERTVIGGILTFITIVLVLYYSVFMLMDLNFDNVTTTTIVMLDETKLDFSITCSAPAGCLAKVQWGSDTDSELSQSSSWTIDGVEVSDYVATDPAESMKHFESSCVHLSSGETLKIDNFVPSKNPELSAVLFFWDRNDAPLGVEIPKEFSSSDTSNGLFAGAHSMSYRHVDNQVNGKTKLRWSSSYAPLIEPERFPCFADHSLIVDGGETALGDANIGKSEIYLNPVSYNIEITDQNPTWSFLGEVGGFVDLVLYALTVILFIYWRTGYRNRRRGPSTMEFNARRIDNPIELKGEGLADASPAVDSKVVPKKHRDVAL